MNNQDIHRDTLLLLVWYCAAYLFYPDLADSTFGLTIFGT